MTIAVVEPGNDLAASNQESAAAPNVGAGNPPAEGTVADLTRGMVAGSDEAYRRFYDTYFPRLLRYLLVLARGDEEAARETLQATLERVVRYIKVFGDETRFWNWLAVLARTTFADRHRKRRRYLAFLDRFQRQAEIHEWPGELPAADNRWLAGLQQLVADLPAEERILVERKYFGRESVRDIARTLQTTEKAVESRLGRIRRKLKDLMLAKLKHETPD